MRVITCLLGFFLFTSFFSSKCFAKGICDTPKISPGDALGVLKLGMAIDEAMQLVGKPDMEEQTGKLGTSDWSKLYYYPSSDLQIYVQDGKIVEIGLGSGTPNTMGCSTSEGIRIGNRMGRKIKKAYRDPDGALSGGVIDVWVYDKRGIEFLVNPEGDVLGISLFASGRYCAVNDALVALKWKNEDSACANFKPQLKTNEGGAKPPQHTRF